MPRKNEIIAKREKWRLKYNQRMARAKADPILYEKLKEKWRKKYSRRMARIKADPVKLAKWREKQRQKEKRKYAKYRERERIKSLTRYWKNPEKSRSESRKSYHKRMARIKADPIIYAKFLEKERQRHLKRSGGYSQDKKEKRVELELNKLLQKYG